MSKKGKISGYYNIYQWMPINLKLGGTKLLVYGFLYNFSVEGKGYYYGDRKFMSEMTGCSERQLSRVLDELCKPNFDYGMRALVEYKKIKSKYSVDRKVYRVNNQILIQMVNDGIDFPDSLEKDINKMKNNLRNWEEVGSEKESSDNVLPSWFDDYNLNRYSERIF